MSLSSQAGPRAFRALAVQPKWHAEDFVSAQAFRRWMRSQLEMCRPHLHPTRPNLVVLTELNGLPLVLRGGAWALRFGTFERVAAALFLGRLLKTLPILLREKVSAVRALQLASAHANAQLYLHVCRDLAQEYGVYLCCGSTPMPRFFLEGERVRRAAGWLSNQTVLLNPAGELIGIADKVHLTPAEEEGGVDLTAGQLGQLRVFPTEVGDLGVAISLDAFRADVIGTLEAQGCTVLLQPDANGAPWTAKEGLPPDPEHLRDQPEAWLESSWQVSTQGRGIRYAVNPMVVGNLLGLTFDGQSAITGRIEDTGETAPRSYVMTLPRAGFLALADWTDADGLESASLEQLRKLGQARAAGSGALQENSYRTDVLWADLTLPPSEVKVPPQTPHEQAVAQLLKSQDPLPESATSKRVAWWAILGLGAAGGAMLWAMARGRRRNR